MASLLRIGTSELIPLLATVHVGRASESDLRLLDTAHASRDHARLEWSGERWTLRDLGSTNGTLLNGKRAAPGACHLVVKGDLLAFGSEENSFQLVDDAPPVPAAVPADRRGTLFGTSDVLLLADGEAPDLVVHRASDGSWTLSRGPDSHRLPADPRVVADGTEWRLVLPGALPPTLASGAPASGAGWALRLTVDPDTRRLAVEVEGPMGKIVLPPRAHQRLLVPLARERVRAARRGIPPAEAGWVAPEDLMGHLDAVPSTFYVQLYRLRHQLAQAGAASEGAPVLERRFTGEVRVGTEQVELVEIH